MYSIEYVRSVVRRDIPALPKSVQQAVKKAIETRLMVDPVLFGKPLRYSLKGYRRLRVGDYRVVFCIEADSHQIIVTAIKHRKDIYND